MLDDDAVRVVEHDPRWAGQAERERQLVLRALAGLAVRVDHVGSTAVPGLPAKPILDLQVSVARLEPLRRYADPLQALGYWFVPDPDSPDYHFFARPAQPPRTHHLHVCRAGSRHERRHLALRDYLRRHPEEAARYGELKRRLAAQHPRDRGAYIQGKDGFLRALEQRALAWRERREPDAGVDDPRADPGPGTEDSPGD